MLALRTLEDLVQERSSLWVKVTAMAASVVAVAGCSAEAGKSGAKEDSVSLECRDGRILIGVAKSESGFASFFDIAGRRGLEVAVDEINSTGGVKGCPLEVMARDTKSDPAVGAQVARSLIEEGAQILVVADDFDTGVAAAKVGQNAGVLTLSLAASSTVFGEAVGDLFFSGGITTTELGAAQAQYAVDQGWKRTFQVIDTGLAYFTEQDDVYRDVYESQEGEVVAVERVDSLAGQSDFSSAISAIKSADPDVVQALAVYPSVGTFVKQLRAAGVTAPVLGNITLQTRELPELIGANQANDIHYAAQVYFDGAGIDQDTDPDITKFVDSYDRLFSMFPEQANAPGAYQTFMAINEALQQDDVVDAKTAAAAIRQQSDLAVPGGTLSGWQDGYAVWDPTIVGLDKGKWTVETTYAASDLRGE